MKILLHFILLLLLSISNSFGQRMIYEDFSYPYDTKLTDIGWIAHLDKGVKPINLTDFNFYAAGGRFATIRDEAGESIHKNTVPIRKGMLYTSFICRFEGPASPKGDYFFHLNDVKGNEIGKVFFKKENNGTYQIGLSKRDESSKINWKNVEKFGGFISIDQVSEIYGLPDSIFQKIKPHLQFESKEIRKINLNTVEPEDLAKHPYFSKKQAFRITDYRKQHGDFSFSRLEINCRNGRICDFLQIFNP